MTRVAPVLVVLGRAGQAESVVPAHGVAHDLDERVLVDVVELALEPGPRVGLPHQRPRRRCVEPALEARLELAPMESEEVRALLALDVDDLDELPCAHLVRERGRGVDAEFETGLGKRRRELLLFVGARRHAPHVDEELGGGRIAVDDAAARRCDDHRHLALCAEALRRAGRRPLAEEPDRERVVRVEAARAELVREQAAVAVREGGAHDRCGCVGFRLERGGVVAAVPCEHRHLGGLRAARVHDGHALVRPEREHRRAARPDDVCLEERVLGEQPPDQGRRAHGAAAL